MKLKNWGKNAQGLAVVLCGWLPSWLLVCGTSQGNYRLLMVAQSATGFGTWTVWG